MENNKQQTEMNKEFIPYELALELKELGFDESCFGQYINGEFVYSSHTNNIMQRFRYAAPLYQQAFRWFREEHLLEGLVLPQDRSVPDPLPLYFIAVESYENGIWSELFNSTAPSTLLHYCEHEEAELACLKKLIEIVNGKQ
jgi:hypothetical protein